MSNKYIKITEELEYITPEELTGPLHEVIDKLIKLQYEWSEWEDVVITADWSHEGIDGFKLVGARSETDDEREHRIKTTQANAQKKADKKRALIRKHQRELEKLEAENDL